MKRKSKKSKKAVKSSSRKKKLLNVLRKKGRALAKTMKRKPFYFTGKKKRARKRRTRRAVPPSQEPIILTKGEIMSGKKRRRSKRRFFGFEGKRRRSRRSRRSYGFEGRRRRRSRRYYGADKASPANLIMKGALAVGGGVIASMAAKALPVKNTKLQAAIPIGIGAALTMLPMTRRNKMVQSAALGAVVIGALSLIRQMWPTVPLLTGDEPYGTEMYIPSQGESAAMLGMTDSFQAGELDGEMDVSGELDGEVLEAMGDTELM